MFTGIIEEKGTLENIKLKGASGIINIYANTVLENTKLGDSIAVNGVCLTVVDIRKNGFSADVMAETIRKTNLAYLKSGDFVNLERAMAVGSRFGGHIVLGHVDSTGKIIKKFKEEISTWVYIKPNKDISRYVISEGSIAVDGISLTAAKTGDDWLAVSIIPHTGSETILLDKNVGDIVNLETDVIGKYVERLLDVKKNENKSVNKDISIEFLAENGFLGG